MKRIYTPYFQEFASRKIILITGPRQSGKTTITKMFSGALVHLNYDNAEDRQIYLERSWDRTKDLIIFDELHKMKNWKRWLKGIFDKEGNSPHLVVTGSASLSIYKKTGDSLAGRYFQYRVHPLDLRELIFLNPNGVNKKAGVQALTERLMKYSGFPEPFIAGNQKFYNLWKKTHTDVILKEDLIYQQDLKEIKSLEILIDLLKLRVASPLSYSSLSRDLECADKTIKRWLILLENMYVIFKVLPFHKNIGRAHLKRAKYYFYDIARVNGEGAKLENLVACSLLKECHFRQDCLGEDWNLYYIGKKGGGELDFLITKDGVPHIVIEVKLSDNTVSKNFNLIEKDFPNIKKIQLVKNIKREKTFPNGVEIRSLNWLANW